VKCAACNFEGEKGFPPGAFTEISFHRATIGHDGLHRPVETICRLYACPKCGTIRVADNWPQPGAMAFVEKEA